MIDISQKQDSARTAEARAVLRVGPALIDKIKSGVVPKGDPLQVSKVAAVQAAKNTAGMIPFCHPLPIEFVGVQHELGDAEVSTTVTVKARYKTGVEMEALTAATMAGLTIYDMLKTFGLEMSLEVTLLSKSGGKSDFQCAAQAP